MFSTTETSSKHRSKFILICKNGFQSQIIIQIMVRAMIPICDKF